MGFILTSLAILSFMLSFMVLSMVLAGILTLFSFLEGAFGFCVACRIYPFVYRLFYKERY
jgi:hypothetical protein